MEAATTSDIKTKFLSNFIPQEIPEGNDYLLRISKEAKSALESLSIPTTRDEYWKYTRVSKILNKKYSQSPSFALKKSEAEKYFMEGIQNRLVFINGFFSSKLSQLTEKNGFIIEPLAKVRKQHPKLVEKYFAQLADHKNQFFTALNTVYHANGTLIFVKKNTRIENPVHIINITDAESAGLNPRNLFVLGKDSNATIIHSYHTHSGSAFTNAVTEIILQENSNLEYYILQDEKSESSQINSTHLSQENSSKAEIFTLTTGGGLVRNNMQALVDGSACETHLYGLYLTKGAQHVDNHTLIDHRKPHSHSNEMYKGIMADKSTGVFNGKVFVRPDAQKTNAYQSNQNILLSDDASINSKPELEIYADDVKCSHGSTTGQLDEEAIFYLRSRGISEEKAKQLLIRAFANEVIGKIRRDSVKNFVTLSVEKSFGK